MKYKPCNNWEDVKEDPRVDFCVEGKNQFWAYLKPAFVNKSSAVETSSQFWGLAVTNFVYADNQKEVIDIINNHIDFQP